MKKLILLAAAVWAAGTLGWLPAKWRDVGDLLPVRALVICVQEGLVALDGGKDLQGSGADWNAAVEDLKDTASGEAFFGAAGQVILTEGAEGLLPDVLADQRLRPAARVYLCRGEADAQSAAEFLDAHEEGVTIQQLQAAVLEGREPEPTLLLGAEGRYRLAG